MNNDTYNKACKILGYDIYGHYFGRIAKDLIVVIEKQREALKEAGEVIKLLTSAQKDDKQALGKDQGEINSHVG